MTYREIVSHPCNTRPEHSFPGLISLDKGGEHQIGGVRQQNSNNARNSRETGLLVVTLNCALHEVNRNLGVCSGHASAAEMDSMAGMRHCHAPARLLMMIPIVRRSRGACAQGASSRASKSSRIPVRPQMDVRQHQVRPHASQ